MRGLSASGVGEVCAQVPGCRMRQRLCANEDINVVGGECDEVDGVGEGGS
jgi:hypothetical protein